MSTIGQHFCKDQSLTILDQSNRITYLRLEKEDNMVRAHIREISIIFQDIQRRALPEHKILSKRIHPVADNTQESRAHIKFSGSLRRNKVG